VQSYARRVNQLQQNPAPRVQQREALRRNREEASADMAMATEILG